MNLMNDRRHFPIDPTDLARLHSLDMALAKRTSVPVLISAPPESALLMATEIAVSTGGGADSVVVVDGAENDYLRSTLIRVAASGGQLRALVVYNVDGLDQAQQSALMAFVTDLDRPGARPCRIISTTSVTLYDRVLQGSFDPALFYRLNKVHITEDGLQPLTMDADDSELGRSSRQPARPVTRYHSSNALDFARRGGACADRLAGGFGSRPAARAQAAS